MHFLAFLILVLIPLNVVDALSKDEILEMCSAFNNQTMIIGIITKGNQELTLERWSPTFEDYLTAALNEAGGTGCATKLIPLGFDDYEEAIATQSIDFFFPNPTAFQEMANVHGIHEFVSVKRSFGEDQILDRFGGVILRAAHKWTDIIEIEDMTDPALQLCAVSSKAFGGWHIQWLEMLNVGLNVEDFVVTFMGNHEDGIRQLFNETGHCDIAIARTETIERLVEDGEMNENDVFTIGEKNAEFNFPQHLSTILYPEWPLASLAHVPRDLEQVLAIPLMCLSADANESIIGEHAGFAFPYSYEPVRQLLISLNFSSCDPGYERETDFPHSCKQCAEGYYSEDGSACIPCPKDTFGNSAGAFQCEHCDNGYQTLEPGSVYGACLLIPPDPTAFIVATTVPIGFIVVLIGSYYVYIRYYLKRSTAGLYVHVFKLAMVAASFSFGSSDFVTDILVVINVAKDPDFGTFRSAYIVASVTTGFALIIHNIHAIIFLQITLVRASNQQSALKFNYLHVAEIRHDILKCDADKEALWDLLFLRMKVLNQYVAIICLLCEDVPFILLNLSAALVISTDDVVVLPGGMLLYLMSLTLSSFFLGYRFFTVSGLSSSYVLLQNTYNNLCGNQKKISLFTRGKTKYQIAPGGDNSEKKMLTQ